MKKLFSLLGITALCSLFLVGCKKKTEKKNDDPKYAIYLKALDAGYDGTYDEWLNSIKGDEVELRVDNGYVQMKYKKDTNWSNLISLDSLKGKDGSNGSDGLSIKSELQVSNGFIQWKNDNETEWTNLISLEDLTGKDGSKVVFNVNEGFINYKYEDSSEWVELISLDTLTGAKGDNGKEVTMSVDDDYILWKYVGDTSWNNLIDLDTLKGEKGDNGAKSMMQVSDGYIQWKNEDDALWTNLVSLETLKGDAGNNGEKSLIQVSEGYIQWKNENDSTWTNLIALNLLKGENGKEVEFRTNDGYVQWKYTTSSEWINLYRYEEDEVTYRVSLYIPYQYSDIVLPTTVGDWQTQTVHAFSKATLPQGITEYLSNLSDYDFYGWYYQGEKWNFSGCVVTEDMDLEARLTKKTKKISFTLNNQTDYAILSNAEFDGSYYNCNEDSYVTFAAINVPNWINIHWKALIDYDHYVEIGYGEVINFIVGKGIVEVLVESEYKELTVYFDASEFGEEMTTQTLQYGDFVIEPNDIDLSCDDYHNFAGWYYGDKLWDFSSDVVNCDVILRAKMCGKKCLLIIDNLTNYSYTGAASGMEYELGSEINITVFGPLHGAYDNGRPVSLQVDLYDSNDYLTMSMINPFEGETISFTIEERYIFNPVSDIKPIIIVRII